MLDPEMTGDDVDDSDPMGVRARELGAADKTLSFKEVLRESLGRFIACEELEESSTQTAQVRISSCIL
jgi:hypothetical protein